MKGWLLDVYPSGEDEMVICFKEMKGETKLLRDTYTPEFYVYGSSKNLERLEAELDENQIVNGWSYEERRVHLRDSSTSEVIEVECNSMKGVNGLARKIVRLGEYRDYELYNVDIPYAQAYLQEKDLFPLAKIELSNPFSLELDLIDSAEDVTYDLPPLKTAKIRVKPEKHSSSRSFDRSIEEISVILNGNETEVDGSDEREKILRFVEVIRESDPDIIVTEGGDSWDLPYLTRRAEMKDVAERLILGRKPEPAERRKGEGKSFFSYGQVYYKPPPHYLKGRIHLDVENSFIYKESGLEGLVELARMTRTPLQRTARSSIGSAMTNLQLYRARKNGVLVPWRKSEPEDFKTAYKLLKSDRGGFIQSPKIGIHEDVGEIDFSSFYPKMMEKYNISPETVLCDCCPDSDRRVPGLNYHICERERGLIPRVLKPVLKKRREYKELVKESTDEDLMEVYDRRQEALKWILVTCFGYLGYRNARFGRIEAHEAVTAFARKNLKKASKIAERNGFEVIHGVVDSLWVKDKRGAMDLADLCERVGNQTGLPIETEGKYRWLVFPTEKGKGRTPASNRYYGLFESGELKTRGIAERRSDTSDFVSRAQRKMLEKLSEARTAEQFVGKIEEALDILRSYAAKIEKRLVGPEALAITRKLSREPGSYDMNSRSAVAAKQLRRIGIDLHPGQQVKYVVMKASSDNPNLRVRPVQLLKRKKYDREWYIQRLVSAAEELLNPFGYDSERIEKSLLRNYEQKRLVET